MSDPHDTSERSPIIVPGEERAPKARSPLIVPGAAAEDSEPAPDEPRPSKIVLPPGAAAEETDDLPEYPRLRTLVLVPFSDGTRELLLVSDPTGVVEGQPVLSIETLPLLQLLDGTLALNDIAAAVARESKDVRVAGAVREFVARLDDLLLLDSPRYHAALEALRAAYHPLEIRHAALEGRSYPADPDALRASLAAHFAEAERRRADAGQPEAARDARPRALMAPHLDPRRAGAMIARTYLELGSEAKGPLRVVVFGTGHSLFGDFFALTRKHFETPLGRLPCDTAFVDRVAARLGDLAYRGELSHRDEHSIEFQAVYLKYRMGERPLTLVPILCGGFHELFDDQRTPRDEPLFEALIDAVREAEAALGGQTLYVAGVDFSHVGPRFGDPPVDPRVKQETEAKDRAALEAALAGDADAWFRAIAAHEDSSRICGLAPTYALLRLADVRDGRLLGYEQSDEPDGSMVTVAAAAWS